MTLFNMIFLHVENNLMGILAVLLLKLINMSMPDCILPYAFQTLRGCFSGEIKSFNQQFSNFFISNNVEITGNIMSIIFIYTFLVIIYIYTCIYIYIYIYILYIGEYFTNIF